MDSLATSTSYLAFLSNNTKVKALESTLYKSLDNFRDLLLDFQELYIESENYKSKYSTQKELCERSDCSSCETLKNIIESKNKIIQSLASLLTRLNETKNFSLIDEAFGIICGDPLSNQEEVKKNLKTEPHNNIEESNMSIPQDVSFKEEPYEIEGTPTGRKSPIIQLRKLKNSTKTLGNSSDYREKTKCPDNWSTSENKSVKLLYLTPKHSKPGSRLRQTRLNTVNVKRTEVVDLTHSPELSAGRLCSKTNNQGVQSSMKKEPLENDIILPSPTSESINFTVKVNNIFNSPSKVKKNPLSLKQKKENVNKIDIIGNTENEQKINLTAMENSINILNQLPKRFQNATEKAIRINPIDYDKTHCETNLSMSLLKDLKKQDIVEMKQCRFQNAIEEPIRIDPIDYDETHCETNLSMSLLEDLKEQEIVQTKKCSPTKRPLTENINIVNTPPKKRDESCENHAPNPTKTVDNVKRRIPELAESIYKEPTVRKKSEKQALPGWSCDKCLPFFGDLYKDNPEMLSKKVEECSKHRGKQNPIVPQSTSNFWNPRWSVPENTEELNRMNNAI